jgi:hypothetical protein
MDARGVFARQRMDLLSIVLILAICADVVRPGLQWLTASGVSPWALARDLERTRDQAELARLRAALGDGGAVAAGARQATIGRAAIITAAKGGTLAEIAAGDFLELLDAEREVHGRPRDYRAVSWRLLRQVGAFGQRAPQTLAQLLTIGQRSPAELIGRLPARLPARSRPDRRLPARTAARPGSRQPGEPRPASGPELLGRP